MEITITTRDMEKGLYAWTAMGFFDSDAYFCSRYRKQSESQFVDADCLSGLIHCGISERS